MDSNYYKRKEMFGLENNKSEIISGEIIYILDKYFGERLEDYAIDDMTDIPYTMFSISFKAYNYFIIYLNYDRGRFGCAIEQGDKGIGLKNSQKWYDKTDMNIFLKELEEQIELRIPDKFLEYHGWKE